MRRFEKGNEKGKIGMMKKGGKEKKRKIDERISKLKKHQKAAKNSINSDTIKRRNAKDIQESSPIVKVPILDSRIRSFNHKANKDMSNTSERKNTLNRMGKDVWCCDV